MQTMSKLSTEELPQMQFWQKAKVIQRHRSCVQRWRQTCWNVIEAEPQNKEARAELKAVQEHLRQLKREEREGEKREFSFASTLSGLGFKEKDLLGDGSIRKQQVSAGDGGKWLNEDWLDWTSRTKCVLHVAVSSMKEGKKDSPVNLSFILGDPDMHEGVNLAVKSMTQGEVANFTFGSASARWRKADLQGFCQRCRKNRAGKLNSKSLWPGKTWIEMARGFEKFKKKAMVSIWLRNFQRSLSIGGWLGRTISSYTQLGTQCRCRTGKACSKWRMRTKLLPPSSLVSPPGLQWLPFVVLWRQGGVGELRLKDVPELPKDPNGDDVSVKLSLMMNRGSTGSLSHCTVKVELEKVVPAVTGPEDARWQGCRNPAAGAFFMQNVCWNKDTSKRHLQGCEEWSPGLSSCRVIRQHLCKKMSPCPGLP